MGCHHIFQCLDALERVMARSFPRPEAAFQPGYLRRELLCFALQPHVLFVAVCKVLPNRTHSCAHTGRLLLRLLDRRCLR